MNDAVRTVIRQAASESWRLPWELPKRSEYDEFRAACLEVWPIPESQLYSLWFHSPIRKTWRNQPTESNPWDDKSTGRIVYHCLHFLTIPKSVTVVAAWYLLHGVMLSDDHVDALIEMVKYKREHGRSKRRLDGLQRKRQAEHAETMRRSRERQRIAKGRRKRLRASTVYEMLPESVDGTGDDLNVWSFNQDRTGTISDVIVKCGIEYKKAVSNAIQNLEAKDAIRKNSVGVWFRLRDPWNSVWKVPLRQKRVYKRPFLKA